MSDQSQPPTGHPSSSPQQLKDIAKPHDHDVLSGRGNFVNYHPGNEHFRSLVRKHKVAYVACPKQQKAKFSRMIVDEIRNRDPPGRFLKQDDKTKLWFDIGDKKALDKTRQALREGAPELLKELNPEDEESEELSSPVQKVASAEPFDVAGGVARLNVDGGVSYHASGMTQGLDVHAQPQLATSSPMMNASPRGMHAPLSHAGRGVVGSIPLSTHPASQALTDLQKQLVSSYPADQLEPTPINPDLTLQIHEAQAELNALQQQLQMQTQQLEMETQNQPSVPESAPSSNDIHASRQGAPQDAAQQLHRDDSLKFQEIFEESTGKKSTQDKKSPSDGHNSSVLSAMSLSMGEMTVSEESNLSAVFEDSVRISDAPPARAVPKVVEKKTTDASKQLQSSGAKMPSSKSMLDSRLMDSFDMSTNTFTPGESNLNLGGSFNAMQMSFTRVFDDDASKKSKS